MHAQTCKSEQSAGVCGAPVKTTAPQTSRGPRLEAACPAGGPRAALSRAAGRAWPACPACALRECFCLALGSALLQEKLLLGTHRLTSHASSASMIASRKSGATGTTTAAGLLTAVDMRPSQRCSPYIPSTSNMVARLLSQCNECTCTIRIGLPQAARSCTSACKAHDP